jgi:GNAT superfamily N-acetyltransferase
MVVLPERAQTDTNEGEPRQPAWGLPADAARLDGPLPVRDGPAVRMRAIRPDDTERLRAFHTRLSPETIELRYFHAVAVLPPDQAEHLTHVDYENRMALVATVGAGAGGADVADESIIAVVRYERTGPEEAEVAFVVEDRWQHHGIASALFARLVEYARARGFTTLVAEVLASNLPMRALLRHAGFPYTVRYDVGCLEMRLDIAAPPAIPTAPETQVPPVSTGGA